MPREGSYRQAAPSRAASPSRTALPTRARTYPTTVADEASPVNRRAWIEAGNVNLKCLSKELCGSEQVLCPYAVYLRKKSDGTVSQRFLQRLYVHADNTGYVHKDSQRQEPSATPFKYSGFFSFIEGDAVCFFCRSERSGWRCYLFADGGQKYEGIINEFARNYLVNEVNVTIKFPLYPTQFQRLLERMVASGQGGKAEDVRALRVRFSEALRNWQA